MKHKFKVTIDNYNEKAENDSEAYCYLTYTRHIEIEIEVEHYASIVNKYGEDVAYLDIKHAVENGLLNERVIDIEHIKSEDNQNGA